ncbi:MAG: hypothetical protein ACYC6R_10715 [Anaerolineales bacterium]
MPTTHLLSEDQLVSELWARDVRFLMGSKPDSAPRLDPAHLIAALAESREARLRLSLIPLFLQHPEFSAQVRTVARNLAPSTRLTLQCYYSAAIWLGQKYLPREKSMPDLFCKELDLTPTPDPEKNLRALAKRHQELSGAHINWLGTYQHAAQVWFKELELQKA